MLKLSIATGWTIDYIEELPESVLQEYMALNAISPFTHDAQAYRDGVVASFIFNKDVQKKKDLRSPEEIFPYLKQGLPEWAKDPVVNKAENLIKAVSLHSGESYIAAMDKIKQSISEQIEIEKQQKVVDRYRVSELEKLLER